MCLYEFERKVRIMQATRRNFLKILGGGVIVAAGASTFAVTRTPQKAYLPWDLAGQYDDPRERAISWAILSPNPHNRQPWMVDLSTPNEVRLHVDLDRLLPHTDPFSRQIVIGLGCFLETMTIAAAEEGYALSVDLFPEGSDPDALDKRPVALIKFDADRAIPDPDFAHLLQRRTQKDAYDTARPVSDELLAQLVSSGRHGLRFDATNDPERVETLRNLSAAAFEVEFATPRTYKESVDLFRIGRAEVDANPDGLDFSGPRWEALHLSGLFTREGSLDPSGFGYTSGLEMVTGNVRTAMAHIWMCTKGNSREDQIAAGRDWMRLNLATTAAGIGLQPLSQALQEFPEMAEHYQEAHKLLAQTGETVQMWARLGYTDPVPRSPRWTIDAKIMNA